jgi:hypothetical protein
LSHRYILLEYIFSIYSISRIDTDRIIESDLSRTRDTETISSREDRSDHTARYTLLMIAESSICEWESIYTPRSYYIHRKYRSRRYSDLDTGDLSDREMIVESGWYNEQKYENKSSKDTSTHR